MNLPEQQRRAYLQAMGIDVWISRDAGDAEPPAAREGLDASNLSWDELRACVAECTQCELHASRIQTVFGIGDQNAEWLIVGEAPGAEEDRHGVPFVGRAGRLLDEMLRAIGLSRDRVFIANILKCRPPNNRDPKAEEAAQCRSYLERQIELVQPKVILAVGKIAAQNLLNCNDPVSRMRDKTHLVNDVPLVVTYHPAYLLRSPSQKAKSWADLCMARQLAEAQPA